MKKYEHVYAVCVSPTRTIVNEDGTKRSERAQGYAVIVGRDFEGECDTLWKGPAGSLPDVEEYKKKYL